MNITKNKKIGIIGMGPVGMIMAVKLREAGCDVSVCVRNKVKKAKIEKEGIYLENVISTHAHFDQVFQNIDDFVSLDLDYLVLALKSYHVPQIAAELEKLNSDKLTVVVAQNGIDVEELYTPIFGESKILRMIVNYAGGNRALNCTRVTFFTGNNYIGSVNDSRGEQAKEFASYLTETGLSTKDINSFELIRQAWNKTILNSSLSALCGVGRMTMAEAINDKDTVELIEQIINEAVEVAEKEKIRFADDFIRQCMRYLKKGGDHFPSLALDLIQGNQTEIDYFNGKIVEYGRKHYVRTSLNLSFTNMVKAMSNKNIISRVPGTTGEVFKKIMDKGFIGKSVTTAKKSDCYLGMDLGSAYAKFVVVDEEGNQVFRYFLPSMDNDKQAFKNVLNTIYTNFNVKLNCTTGYGRKHFTDTDLVKTEINCAAAGVSFYFHGEKNILDIGGEDIKVIHCDKEDHVETFYMNDKCAAGTGSFLSEIAERAAINISEMSNLAALSDNTQELNSFCTVFAKTEIMNWVFDGMKPEDIARGIYISIANKVAKMHLKPGIPTYMIGGVVAHHPFIREILNQKFKKDIQITENPQFMVAMGAALIARNTGIRNKENGETETTRSLKKAV
jgi:2-dehydropantoate 2-reductase